MNILKASFYLLFLIIFFVLFFIFADWIIAASDRYRVFPVDIKDAFGKRGVPQEGTIINPKKKSLIVIGCSFAFGVDLRDEDTLAYRLQQYTHRKTYNYGYPAHGIQHVLYKIQKSDDFAYDVKDAEYVIYVFFSDHLRRLHLNFFDKYAQHKYLKYKKQGISLKEEPFHVIPIDYFKITTIGKRSTDFFSALKNDEENFNLFKLYLLECKKSLYEKNPNCKFVILVYNSNEILKRLGLKQFHTNRWKELEDEGFIIINFDTNEFDYLNTDDFIASDEIHPSAAVWKKLVPVISDKLGL